MKAEPQDNVIEIRQSKYGARKKRKDSKCLVSEHTTTDEELNNLSDELVELKQKRRRLEERILHIQAKIRASTFDLRLTEAAKGNNVNRVNIASPDAPTDPKVQVQHKNQFRDVDVADYPGLYNDIGPEAYEAFVEEVWTAKTQPGFNEGDFIDSIILGITELLGDGKRAQDAAWYCWNTCQRWMTFDVKHKVKSSTFSFRLGNMRERMTPSQRAAMQDFCEHAQYKAAVVVIP